MSKRLIGGLTTVLLPIGLYGMPMHTSGSYQRSYLSESISRATMEDLDSRFEVPSSWAPVAVDARDLALVAGRAARELIIIDAAVPDKQVLYRGARPGLEIVELTGDRDGLVQLTEVLSQYTALDALHVVSHAQEGVLLLGNSRVDAEFLRQEMDLFSALNGALKDGADLLLYGCDLAKGDASSALLDILQANSDLDIAASNNLTGSVEQGGDWELEVQQGQIETNLAFSQKALLDFSVVLAPTTDDIKGLNPQPAVIENTAALTETSLGSFSIGQSFTATKTGELSEIGVAVVLNEYISGLATLKVYQGEGTSGALLYTKPNISFGGVGTITDESNYTFHTIDIASTIQLTGGQTYTFMLSPPTALDLAFTPENYLGGVLYIDNLDGGPNGAYPDFDMAFRVVLDDAPWPADPAPAITSAAYDAWTGTLVVAGSDFIAVDGVLNDIDASKFTFKGEGGFTHTLSDTADVDITSASSFTLTLGEADKAAINVILNKEGSSSINGEPYNLGAAEDWAAGADAATAIADITDNPITVVNVLGSALEFDGNDRAVVTNSAFPDLSGTWTVEAWVKPHTTAQNNAIFDIGGNLDLLILSDGRVEVNAGAANPRTGNNVITANTWQHIALVADPSDSDVANRLRLYVNGEFVDFVSEDNLFSGGSFSGDFYIGSRRDGAGTPVWMDGAIDELRVWNEARTQAQIQAHMNMELVDLMDDAATDSLMAYYPMNGFRQTLSDWTDTKAHGLRGNSAAAEGDDPVRVLDSPAFTEAPTVTNLTQTVTYTEDDPSVALGDIVVVDPNAGETITATLKLSTAAAGSLSTGTYGAATSAFDSKIGIWTASGSTADVNSALAAVAFVPSANWDQDATITTRIRDAANTGPADGTITLEVTPVNDAPTDITLSGTTVSHSGGSSAVLGNLETDDVDDGVHTYSLVAGMGDDNNSSFYISDDQLRAKDAQAMAPGSHSVRIQTSDGDATYEESFTITIDDDMAPTVQTLSPADNATDVAPGDDLVVTFTENILPGKGFIVIHNADTEALTSIEVSDPQISISADTMTINPTADLSGDTRYYITIDGDAVRDSVGNAFGGITTPEGWNFTVPDVAPPAVTRIDVSGSPPANASTMSFRVYFNEVPANVSKEDFAVTATGSVSASVVNVSPVNVRSVDVYVHEIVGDGTLRLDVKANSGITDTSGNGNGKNGHVPAYSSGALHTVDRVPPSAPTLSLAPASDTGISNTDRLTNDTTPTVNGTAEPGSKVTIGFSMGGSLGSAVTDGDGNWSFTPGSLPTGSGYITATATDPVGNVSAESAPLAITLDTTAPTVSTIAPAAGAQPADETVTFTVSFDDTVHGLSDDDFELVLAGTTNAKISSVSASSGDAVDVVVSGITGTGTVNIKTTGTGITDAAGNVVAAFAAGDDHQVDRDAPTIDGVAFNQNLINASNQTKIGITLSGAETGTTASYIIRSSEGDESVSVSGDGAVTVAEQQLTGIDVSSLPDGTLTAYLTLTDEAGNANTDSYATVLKDTEMPAVTSVTVADGTYKEGDQIDVEVTLDEMVTVDTINGTPSISLTIGTDSRSAVFSGVVQPAGRVPAPSFRSNILKFSYTVAAGDNDSDGITLGGAIEANGATLRDDGDNDLSLTLNGVASTTAVLVDTTAPAKPAAPDLDAASDTGASDSDNITMLIPAALPVVRGTAEPESTIVITVDGNGSSPAFTADENGNWTYTLPGYITDGTYALTVTATDAAGNTSEPSDVLTLTFDTTAPAIGGVSFDAPQVDGTNLATQSFTLAGAELGASAEYEISDGGATPITGSFDVTDAEGQVRVPSLAGMTDGTLTLSLTLTDTAGNVSTPVTDTILKEADPVLVLPADPAEMIDGATVAMPGVAVTGTLSTSIAVELSVTEGSIEVDASGTATVNGNASNAVSITGTLSDVNAALTGLSFTAAVNTAEDEELVIHVDDGVGTATSSLNIAITDRPDIDALDGMVTFTIGSSPVRLDTGADALVTDLDNADFDGGTLSVALVSGGAPAPAQNQVSIATTDDVVLHDVAAGSGIEVLGTVIGTLITDISNDQPLEIALNANATLANVSLLLQSLTYENTHGNPTVGTRGFDITLDDGKASRTITLNVNVQYPPEPAPSNVIIDTEKSDGNYTGTVTITPEGTLNGGTVTGTINNGGTIAGDVTLGANTTVNGGVITGNIAGNAEQPARINGATIEEGAHLTNVVIGADTILDPGVILGPNVKFESEASIPPGIDLTPAFRTLNWLTGDDRGVAILTDDVVIPGAGEDPMTIIRAIQLLDMFEPSGNEAGQNPVNGEILVVTGDFRAAVLPVMVSQAGTGEPEGVSINEDGDIVIVAVNRRVVLSYPVLASRPEFVALLEAMGLALDFDNRANLLVRPAGGTGLAAQFAGVPGLVVQSATQELYFSARPDVLALPAFRGTVPGLLRYPVEGLGSFHGVSMIFESADGELLEQTIAPIPADWFALKAAVHAIEGVTDVRIDPVGVITATLGEVVVRGMVDFTVIKGEPTTSGEIEIRLAEDLTGNGQRDYEIVYANGDRQLLFIFQ